MSRDESDMTPSPVSPSSSFSPSSSPWDSPYAVDGQCVPREQFYALACDPARSVVVEACAGAGKTWMLVSRILRALLDGAEPHEILAITFTRKAAGEMRERLSEWLQHWADPGVSAQERVRELRARGVPETRVSALADDLAGLHERLLHAWRQVEVRTFHAWFSQLMRHAPLALLDQLGLQPGMALLEKLDEHEDDIFRRFHEALLHDAAALADHRALVAAHGQTQVRAWLRAAMAKQAEISLADAAGTLERSVPAVSAMWPALAGVDHPAEQVLQPDWHQRLVTLAARLGQSKGQKARDAANGLTCALGCSDALARYEAMRQAVLTKEGAPRQHLGDSPELLSLVDDLGVIDAQIRQQQAQLEHLRMVRLSRHLFAALSDYKRRQGLADMGDLERCALHLLRDSSMAGWVQERLDARVRHVLIDEFQDTSPLQWHALKSWLSAYAGAGGGASGHKPPAVFIVGDPKQSIYRFRGGDPRVFDEACELVLTALGGHRLACDHTQRNGPSVLEGLNAVFGQAQRQGSYPGFRPHTSQVAVRADGSGLYVLPEVTRPPTVRRGAEEAARVWRDSLQEARHEPDEVLREQEARLVAEAIAQSLASGQVQAGEVFVLCRKRESLRWVARALQERHLPFVAPERFGLMASPEVADLVAVLDVLASPGHRLSLARCLRSPLFGASDADLVHLHGLASQHAPGDSAGDWWGALMMQSPELPLSLQRAQRLLRDWQQAAQSLPPHDVLDRIVAEGEMRERVAAALPPERRASALHAIDALLHVALTLDGARYASTYSFVRALKRRALEVMLPAQQGAIQLLTIHGAKGLEAKVVFVMDCAPQGAKADSATVLVDWPVADEAPARCAFVYSAKTVPPSLADAMEAELAHRAREELNSLYVAMTRARERLVFSATAPQRADKGLSWWQRVQGAAIAWTPQPSTDETGVPGDRAFPPPTWPALPRLQRRGGPSVAAPSAHAMADDCDALTARTGPQAAMSTPASRLGQAVHRVLEWATAPLGGAMAGPVDLPALALAASREFDSSDAEVLRIARAIWESEECRPFFAHDQLLWAGNEVAVVEAGEMLRIDRLVAVRDASGARHWWVLDYKVAVAGDKLATYAPQMQRYRRAVQALQPGEVVRCALITGQGQLVELPGEAGH